MAVTDVDLIRRTGGADEEGQTRIDTYRVIFDAVPTDIAGSVLSADDGGTAIPAIGDNFSGSTTIKCKRLGNITPVDGTRLVYTIDANYDNKSSSSTVTTNPLSRPAEIEWGFVVVDVVAEKDNGDNRIENSAGDPFDPPILDRQYRLTCTITRNVSSHDPSDAYAKINTVNSASVTIAGATFATGQALLTDYSAVAMYEGSTDYIQQRFTIEFAPTHDVEVGDMGYYYIDASDSNTRKEFTDDQGKPSRVQRYLTSSGDDGGSTVRYLTFSIKQTSNFGALGLPTSFPDF